jgi:ABC-type bacteriocin/lantibiotic exporter with double-glycine peptidase domain
MRTALLISFLFICCASGSLARGDDEHAGDIASRGGFACGLSAAYIFLNRAGHHADYGQLEREFQAQHPPDSLLAIRNILGMHGCRTSGIKVDADYFLENHGPAIVLLQLGGYGRQSENHFSYLSGASRPGGAVLLDPVFDFNQPCGLTWDHFSRIFQGVALVPYD